MMKSFVAALLLTLSVNSLADGTELDRGSFNNPPDYDVSLDEFRHSPAKPAATDPRIELMEERARAIQNNKQQLRQMPLRGIRR